MKKLYFGIGIIAVGGLAFAVYRYFKAQASLLMNYEYKVIGAKIVSIKASEIILDFKIRFISKADIEATVNKIYLDIFVEGVNAGYLTENKSFVIPAKGSSDIDLRFAFNPQIVLRSLASILISATQRRDFSFSLKGFANVKSGFVSTTIPIDYSSTLKAYL